MQKYGLIGFPLKHSFSIEYFNEKFASENIDAKYVNFEIPDIKDFPEVIEENPDLCGLNVTIPYKEKVIPYLDRLSPNAERIGAINVIKIIREKGKKKVTLEGHNSDIVGFSQSIKPLLMPYHQKALILGTGGASKAVCHGLKDFGIETQFVSRTKKPDAITYEELTPEVMKEYKVIVNCTPVGMYPKVDFCPEIPYGELTSEHLLYDLLYNPNETLFMKKGEKQHAVTKNGLEMLLLQAFISWEIWNRK
jgi:shikimate dehydrogenase